VKGPGQIRRRTLFKLAAASAVTGATPATAQPAEKPAALAPIIDTNVSLFHWPFRRLPMDETPRLVEKLRSLGVTQAWAGSFEGLLHRDLSRVNQRLAAVCESFAELIPIGSMNPMLPGWERDLQQCGRQHQMPGIRVHPNYHGYRLDDPAFATLLRAATHAGMFVQLPAAMEDVRTQSTLVQVADVDLSPLPKVMRELPAARVQILNHRVRGPLLDALAQVPGLYFDTARVEGTDGVPALVRQAPAGRVLLGTHAPFLVPEAALIRIHESDELDQGEVRAVLGANAARMLAGVTA
jgi:predicted TIM-barrel fold metal-dependent hydrolase